MGRGFSSGKGKGISMTKLRRALAIGALIVPLSLATGGDAFAKITAEPTSCETKNGQQPGGQQPGCKGGGLDQNTENQNPSGKAPAGQNK